jgi:hypothetical protein
VAEEEATMEMAVAKVPGTAVLEVVVGTVEAVEAVEVTAAVVGNRNRW